MIQRLSALLVTYRKRFFWSTIVISLICFLLFLRVPLLTDMTAYLPDSSSMKQGVRILSEQFPDMSVSNTIRVMFTDVPEEEKAALYDRLTALTGVDSVSFVQGDPHYDKAPYTQYILNFSWNYGSQEEVAIEKELIRDFSDVYSMTMSVDDTMGGKVPLWVAGLAVLFILTILTLMSSSYIEPYLFLLATGLAIIINLGTNLFIGGISDITYSIAAILQLVLSMDYSVILMNRYQQELAASDEPVPAMERALASSFSSIASSSFTTVAGLLALLFMAFKIGGEMGFVLAKGVLISMICIFTSMPAMILACDKLIRKTAKKPLPIPVNRLSSFEFKARSVIPFLFAILFIVMVILKGNTAITFTMSEPNQIDAVFPKVNQIVVLYRNEDEDAAAGIASDLQDLEYIEEVNAWSTTLGRPFTAAELSEALGQMIPALMDMGAPDRETADPGRSADGYAAPAADSAALSADSDTPATDSAVSAAASGSSTADSAMSAAASSGSTDAEKSEAVSESSDESTAAYPEPKSNSSWDLTEILSGWDEETLSLLPPLAGPALNLLYYEKALSEQASSGNPASTEGTKEAGGAAEAPSADPASTEGTTIAGGAAEASTASPTGEPVRAAASDVFAFVRELLSSPFLMRLAGPEVTQARAALSLLLPTVPVLAGSDPLTEDEFVSRLSTLSEDVTESILHMLFRLYISQDSPLAAHTETLPALISFTADVLPSHPVYGELIDSNIESILVDMKSMMEGAASMLQGPEYSLMAISASLADEGEQTFSFMDQLSRWCSDRLERDSYLIGNTPMAYELYGSFGEEMNRITLLTAATIFTVVAITFRSLLIPLVLVLMIQTAVYATMVSINLQGSGIYYLALLMVQSILMGATIDYAILFTSYYRESRTKATIQEALRLSYEGSIHTILTSGSLIVLVTFILGYTFGNPTIGQICHTIAMGSTASLILIIFLLPGTLAFLDRWICKGGQKDASI